MTLQEIQRTLKAPKNQKNTFGGFNYRNCEDILEAVKPLLGECKMRITDDIIAVGDRVYVKATVLFEDSESQYSVSGFAREPQTKKGFDESQLTGAASSYARKYALNGLFLIDDTKDADSHDNTKQETNRSEFGKPDRDDLMKELNTVLAKAVSDMILSPDKQAETIKAAESHDDLNKYVNQVEAKLDKIRKEISE